jgi:3-hydroxyisobutyrate dehydrogenase-like beta-hydroxyacid dehydrogenase
VKLPTSEAANAVYLQALARDQGDQDFSAVINAFQK